MPVVLIIGMILVGIWEYKMKIFNAFQLVAAFVAWPFLISWLSSASFQGHAVAFYGACVCYVVAFGFMVAAVASALYQWDS